MEQKRTVTNAGGTGKQFSLFDLKLLAILAMVVDHAALNFVPDDSWLSVIMHFITIFMGVLAVAVRRRVKNPILKAVLILLLLTLAIPGDWGVLGFAVIIAFDFYYGNFKNQAFAYLILIIYQSGIIAMITNPVYQFMSQGTISQDFGFYKYMIRELGLFLPLIVLRFYNGTSGASKNGRNGSFIFFIRHTCCLAGLHFSSKNFKNNWKFMYELPEAEEKGLILWRFRFILVKQCR